MIYFNRAWGMLVFAKGMAPCLLRTSTITLSSLTGLSTLTLTPQVESVFLSCQTKVKLEAQNLRGDLVMVMVKASRDLHVTLQARFSLMLTGIPQRRPSLFDSIVLTSLKLSSKIPVQQFRFSLTFRVCWETKKRDRYSTSFLPEQNGLVKSMRKISVNKCLNCAAV